MRYRAIIGMALAGTALPPAPAHAWLPPPPPPPTARYGPLLGCHAGFAVEVAADEAMQGPGLYLVSQRGNILLGFASTDDADWPGVQRLGEIDVPGLGRVRRLLVPPKPPMPAYHTYLLRQDAPAARWVQISSNRFDGTERDLAILGRLMTGAAAQATCAAAPPAQQFAGAAPDPDALHFARAAVPGPLAYCFGRVAIDLQQGESARRHWVDNNAWTRAQIVLGTGSVTFDGFARPQGDEAASGPLGGAGYRVEWSEQGDSGRYRQPGTTPPGRFDFAITVTPVGTTRAEAEAVVARLRWRTAADRCLPAVDQPAD